MHILDDPALSPRVRRFLDAHGRRIRATPADWIRTNATVVHADGRQERAPEQLMDAMVAFEERYGGLWYPVLGGNGMEHGLDGEATAHWSERGWILPGAVIDGDWTWGVDVLIDGRTAMRLPDDRASHRIIDRSVEQRIESHALVHSVREWAHRHSHLLSMGDEPALDTSGFPPPVPQASGPSNTWWADEDHAIHLQLHTWWQPEVRWILRCFTRHRQELDHMATLLPASDPKAVPPRDWCELCGHFRMEGEPCFPEGPADDGRSVPRTRT
ncbi:hypothetical protein ACFQLX_24365 [Streptomyces polyrhachis]|uniref:SUKH-4 immunity protein of toxin-antitoxin system n=1 Tax=Streptomyces polyrhachis TaxID=1282885 RepID=A0ABW2GKS2_9ACTN